LTLLSFAPLIVLPLRVASLAGSGAQWALLKQIGWMVEPAARDAAQSVIASGQSHPFFANAAGWASLVTLLVVPTKPFPASSHAFVKALRPTFKKLPERQQINPAAWTNCLRTSDRSSESVLRGVRPASFARWNH